MIFERVIYGEVTVLNILVAVLICFGALILSKVLGLNIRRSFKDKVAREHLELFVKITSYTIVVIAVIWALPHIGVEPSGLLVAGGIVGLAIGFASQSIVGNLVSGLFLVIERPVKIGDMVEIDGVMGFVEDIRIISTTIRTFEGLYVRIPNETVFTAKVTNFVAHAARRFEYTVGIRYSDDADRAIEIINSTIDGHPLALKSPAPMVFVDELGDNSVNIIVRIWAPTTEWLGIKMELLWKIKSALEAEGIEIPFPQRVLWFPEKLTTEPAAPSSTDSHTTT